MRGEREGGGNARLEQLPFESALVERVALVVLSHKENVCAAIQVSESSLLETRKRDALGLSERGMSSRQSSCEAFERLVHG